MERINDEELNKYSLLTKDEVTECEELATIGVVGQGEDADLQYQANYKYATRMKMAEKLTQAQLEADRKDEKDGLWCPRCGKVFHDEDIEERPNDYWRCPTCSVWEHNSCRHLPDTLYLEITPEEAEHLLLIFQEEIHFRDPCPVCSSLIAKLKPIA